MKDRVLQVIAPGQESVWDYPRPPAIERCADRIRVRFANHWLVDSINAVRVLETSHPPTIYIPRDDADMALLGPSPGRSYCEWKGKAEYFSATVGDRQMSRVAWSYPSPTPAFAKLAGYLAFYPSRVDECWVGNERASAQAGDFYGGWITSRIAGPFKGEPGSDRW